MKLQARLAIVILTIFFTGWIVAGLSAFALEEKTAHDNSIHSAQLLLNVAAATRDYTSTQINPLIASLVEGQKTDQFYPQAVPSYSSQQVLSILNTISVPHEDYTYVERALNPTNPHDLAEGWQVELIQHFIQNPDVPEIIGHRLDANDHETLYVAKPIRIESPKCLDCHSTPEKAPVALIKKYGSERGFNWNLNEVIGTRIVSVPTAVYEKQAQKSIVSSLLLIASVFLIAYAATVLIVQNWIVKPLDVISHQLEEISLQRSELSQLSENKFKSLGKLNRSINRLLISLNKALEQEKK